MRWIESVYKPGHVENMKDSVPQGPGLIFFSLQETKPAHFEGEVTETKHEEEENPLFSDRDYQHVQLLLTPWRFTRTNFHLLLHPQGFFFQF